MKDLEFSTEVRCKKTRTLLKNAGRELFRQNTTIGERVYSRILSYTKGNDEIEKVFRVSEGNKLFSVWFRIQILNKDKMKFSIKIKQLDRNWKQLG